MFKDPTPLLVKYTQEVTDISISKQLRYNRIRVPVDHAKSAEYLEYLMTTIAAEHIRKEIDQQIIDNIMNLATNPES